MTGRTASKRVLEHMKALNRDAQKALVQQLRSPFGVVPFVGAGMSAAFGLPPWGTTLRLLAKRAGRDVHREVREALAAKRFEMAASRVANALGEDAFQHAISAALDDGGIDRSALVTGLMGLLPSLTTGPVVTTNFDRILELAFDAAGRRFEGPPVLGANQDEIIPALRLNRRVLWKIHGDLRDRRTRAFTREEYEQHYKQLEALLGLLALSRPLLFVGCSLTNDRTLEIVKASHRQCGAVWHFAIAQAEANEAAFDQRARELREAGVLALFYPKDDHAKIEPLLVEVLRETSGFRPHPRVPPNDPPELGRTEPPSALLEEELVELVQRDPPRQRRLDVHALELVASRIRNGEIAFFLGAAACAPYLPLADSFYADLSRELGIEDLQQHPAHLLQHYVDTLGEGDLEARVDRQLALGGTAHRHPTAIHHLIATLRRRLIDKGYGPKPLLVLTSNQDDWLESALRHAREPYHLFAFCSAGEHRGRWLYRNASGKIVRVIDKPEHFLSVPDDSAVVVKYHGGRMDGVPLRSGYVMTQRGVVELAGLVPRSVPRVILDRLGERSLLFLGSSLRDDSIEALVRALSGGRVKRQNWALVPVRAEADRAAWEAHRTYWGQLGVEFIDATFGEFLPALEERLRRL